MRVDKTTLEIEIRERREDSKFIELNKDLDSAGKKYRNLQNELDKLNDKRKKNTSLTAAESDRLKELEVEVKKAFDEYQKYDRQKTQYMKENKLEIMTIQELSKEYRVYNNLIRNLDPNSSYYEQTQDYLEAIKNRMSELNRRTIETKSSLQKFLEWSNAFGFAITNALDIKDRIVNWADQYVQSFAKMDDTMTDVMKYTGQTKREVEEMNETFKQMTTRTPREELNALAGAAGRLGIQGKKDIEGFVDAADKINVALGDDLGEGAIDQIGKLTMVFGEDKTKGLNGAMLATGSAINVLGASSSANTGFITEFTSRMAGMAVNAKISQTDIMGYASALSQAGIEGETASGVFAQMITKMFTDPARFAKAAGLEVKSFTELLKTDANQAILQFLQGLKQNGGFENLAPALKSLKMQGTQAVPVISSLINKMDELKTAQDTAKKAYDDGTSIIEEFNNANSSAAAQLEIAKKALHDEAVALGQQLMPIVQGSIKASTTALKIIKETISFLWKHRDVIIAVTAAIAGYTAVTKGATILTTVYTTVTKGARLATLAFNAAIKANPIGLMIGGLTSLIGLMTTYTAKTKAAREEQEKLNEVYLNPDGTVKSDPTVKKRNQLDEIVVVGTRKTKDTTPPVKGDTKENKCDKQRKEAEARLKADFEREKILLKQQYQGKKELKDEWQLKEVDAERSYLDKLMQVRKQYGATESELMEVQNQALDTIAKEANIRVEARKRDQQQKLKDIDQQQAADELQLARQQLTGEISTQREYDERKLQCEIDYQKKRLEVLTEGSDEYRAAQNRLERLGLEQLKLQLQPDTSKQNDQNWNNNALQSSFGLMGSFDTMREANQAAYDQDLINFQQYQQNKTQIAEQEEQSRQQIQQAAFDAVNGLMSSAGSLFSAMQQRETSQVEKKYKKQIEAAKKSGKDTTKLEEQMEAEKAEIQKKYAQKQFKLQILQIIAATAQSIANVWKEWAAQPVVAAALSAVAAAQGAMQLATAKAQADAAAGLYEGGYSEGYTEKGNPKDQAGVIPVHKNEFVANHKAVANSQIRPVLDVIDRHQKAGDVQMLNATQMLEEAYGRGRYRGGYASDGDNGSEGDQDVIGPFPQNPTVVALLRRIADASEDSLTVRELRKEIKHQERLEANAGR